MRLFSCVLAAVLVAMAVCRVPAPCSGQELDVLEEKLRAGPRSLAVMEELAEAYLRECHLESSLELWKEILERDREHKRAAAVVGRLVLQELDLDSHLRVLETLIGKGVTAGAADMLDAAARRAATEHQKARILYLRGLLASRMKNQVAALTAFEAASTLYPETGYGGRAAIAVANADRAAGRTEAARRMLAAVAGNDRLDDEEVREEAQFNLVLLESKAASGANRVAVLRKLLPAVTSQEVRRKVIREIALQVRMMHRRWTPEAIDVMQLLMKSGPPHDEAMAALGELSGVLKTAEDAATLDRLLKLLLEVDNEDAAVMLEASLVRVDALLTRAVIETQTEEMTGFVTQAHDILDRAVRDDAVYLDHRRIHDLRGRAYLVHAQKLVALESPTLALPVLQKARAHYLSGIALDPKGSFARLDRMGRLLEHMQEWEMAAQLYREVAARYPHLVQGRDALLKVARLHERHMNAPVTAMEVYAEYAARFPAEVSLRQLRLGRRLQRLGYRNLLDFQKRTGLTPDGIYGSRTRSKLKEMEDSFDMIGRAAPDGSAILRGQFVHPSMYAIARRMADAGRHLDAIRAYRLCMNLFPTKREADDALIAIARLFRDNLLFEEALGAYRELMDDYPEGDVTSRAYVEAAACLENLGRWKEAEEYYKLYIKKFPQYQHARLCGTRLTILEKIRQYQDFVENNPRSPKLAEARYQIGTILYKELKNHTRAAFEFRKVAEEHPGHIRAADALFTAGTALLHSEDFPGARREFAELVERFPDSRLADDGQYWIGHTYEYSARALGKLDQWRIILKRRALQSRDELVADMELRRHYFPAVAGAAPGQEMWAADTLGVLGSGSIRDRVNADLFRAVHAYRVVVDRFKTGDMAEEALLRIAEVYTTYLKAPDKGIRAYQELLSRYPGSREAADALHRVGNYLLGRRKYAEAIKLHEQFIYNYPADHRVEDAMLAIARCYVEKKTWDRALDAYQSYLNKYPVGKQVQFAKAQVEWIRMYHF